MKKLREFLFKGLSDRVGNNLYVLEDVTLVSFAKCYSKMTKSSEFYVYLKIFFDLSVNRNKLEDMLIKFTKSSIGKDFYYFDIGNV